MNNVYVMLSTYNGEKYLKEQINSVIVQKNVKLKLRIRDDGSKDKTLDIIKEYSNKYDNIEYFVGSNVGACNSFLELIYESPDCEYYAFCDQDDYWYPEKLYKAIEQLEKYKDIPAMYFSKKNLVDKDRKKMAQEDTKVNKVTYGASLFSGVAYGCTMVINKEAMQLIKKYKPTHMAMHDIWVWRVVAAFGKVIYDPNSYIDYRQHGNNCVGAKAAIGKRILLGLESIVKRKDEHYRSEAASEMYNAFGNIMNERNRKLTYELANAPKSMLQRVKLFFNKDMESQTFFETMILKFFVLLGWI